MIPNEMKSWREVMDDVARLTKERDVARDEREDLRLRLASTEAHRDQLYKKTQNQLTHIKGLEAKLAPDVKFQKERDDARAEVNRVTTERDEAMAELERMREIESAELRDLREQVIRIGTERDEARAEVERLTAERDAYRRAKQENDERFMNERDDARAEVERLRRAQNERAIAELSGARVKALNEDVTWSMISDHLAQRIAALRAEQAAEPAAAKPPAEAVRWDAYEQAKKDVEAWPEWKRKAAGAATPQPEAPARPSVRDLLNDVVRHKPDSEVPLPVLRLLRELVEIVDALAARGGAQ